MTATGERSGWRGWANGIPVVQVGLGPIGCEVLRAVHGRRMLRLTAAVDIDPAKAGRDAGEIAGIGAIGVSVSSDIPPVTDSNGAVALHTTGSYLDQVMGQLEALIEAGYHVVSTCEELAYPQALHFQEFKHLDALARARGVAVLGTGVNPGYVFDTLILTATAVCQKVEHIRARRVLDAGKRRLPLQQKVGAGLSVEEFQRRVDAGLVRHVGLGESIRMVTDALGWGLSRTEEETEPVIATEERRTEYLTVPAGAVAGVHQTGRAFSGDREVLSLDLQMYVGAPESYDEIEVSGTPPLKLRIEGGAPGDPSTAAIAINAIPAVLAAPPGLTAMPQLRLVHCWGLQTT